MTSQDICWMSARELARAIREKDLSPVEVVTGILDRIGVVNPKLNAYVTVTADSALDEARRAEDDVMQGRDLGPLHGVPLSIKDLMFTKGVRTTMGSRLLENFVPDEDAVIVSRLKSAGAIVLGKTNTPEFGLKMLTDNLLFGATRNPWDLERSPGGSSGGAAAAVAAGMGPLAAGSDGGGSIRIPSSCCGVFGIKPQLGRVPRYPTFHGAEVFIHEGPIARTVGDAALMLDVTCGPHWGDVYSVPAPRVPFVESLGGGVKGMKVAWSPDMGYAETDPEVRDICESAARRFAELGAVVDEAHPGIDNPEAHHATIYTVDHVVSLWSFGSTEEIQDVVDPLTATILYVAADMRASDYARAMFARVDLAAKLGEFFQEYDLLLTPTLAAPPPRVEFADPAEFLKWIPFILVFSMTGQPAASIPAGWTKGGLPVGLQVIGRPYDEGTVFRAAAAFEEAFPWADRKPPLS
jgi:aspartyl-tRNA(Asn)/glutamyl-tRNA(Gln) amidotransferase subunit A